MNSKITFLILTFSVFVTFLTHAQMNIDGQILYGNEWVNHDQTYFKVQVDENGIYRLTYQELNNAGVFSEATIPTGAQLKLYHFGQPVPIYVSTQGALSTNDFIEFVGEKNRGELDVHLYENPENQFNPEFSMFTDVSSYFLTWNDDASLQYANTPNDLSNLPPNSEPYCIHKKEVIYSSKLDKGRDYGSSSWRCSYDLGEGFGKGGAVTNTASVNLNLESLSGIGPDIKLIARLLSKSGSHNVNVSVNNSVVVSEQYTGWAVKEFGASIPLGGPATNINTVQFDGVGTADNDIFRLSYVAMEYPRTFDFGGADYLEFKVEGGADAKYLEISNFNHNGANPILFDLTTNIRLETNVSGGLVQALLPPSVTERELVLVSTNSISTPLSIQSKQFENYDFVNGSYDYIILTHPFFFDDGNGNNLVQDYANYRASLQGGEYESIIVDVLDVYDQFGYGVDRHEGAIKNFLAVAADTWSSKLLFLLGKGATYELMRTDPAEWQQFAFVPSFGYPSSDHLFVTPLGETNPRMGVGRLAAKNHNDIQIYLNKIIEYESVPTTTSQTLEDKEWMKKILHFGGGDENIQDQIKNELNSLKDTIENSIMGADVTSFFKNSSDVVVDVPLDQVVPLINEGALMLTFFGHSAPSTLDFDLGEPTEYQNQGKYPLFYAIGCNTNRVFEVESTLSEDFVLIEDRGCIGFFGATWVTALGNLSQYGKYFYKNLGTDNYGEPLGQVIKATIEDYSFSNSYTAELLRNALVLHGDPAIRLYPFDQPDYLVKKDETVITPSLVNNQLDSFGLELVISNLGRGVEDSINVHLEHELSDGDIIDLGILRVAAPFNQGQWGIQLPLLNTESIGQNYINITVDADDEIQEGPSGAELNNTEKIPFFVVSNDIFPVYPYDYSIEFNTDIKLKASTANTFSDELSYYFEIDTTELFNSPIKESTIISSEGGVIDWEPSIAKIDSTVYYWRVSIDSTAISGGFNWHNSSFIYIDDNPPGWNQSHYYQYIKDDFNSFIIDEDTRTQTYGSITQEFKVQNGTVPNIQQGEIKIFRDGFVYYGFAQCGEGTNTIWINVFQPTNLDVKPTAPGQGANFNCFPSDAYVSITNPNTFEGREKTIDFLQNEILDGEYVIIFTSQDMNDDFSIDEWADDSITLGTNIFQLLEAQGATQIRDMIDNPTPYILMYKHNDPSFPVSEAKAVDLNEIIEATSNFEGKDITGSLSSTVVGPASDWETVLWAVEEYDPSTENANIDVYGLDANGNETLVLDSLTVFEQDLSSIAADEYPFLKLVYNSTDEPNRTPPQLKFWRVHFVPTPEAALAPNKQFSFQSDTLQQGETLSLEIGIENLGGIDMDSMLMHYTIIDAQNNEILKTDRLEPLLVDDLITGQLSVETQDLSGENRLIIEANPNGDQPELHHYNNIGVKTFFVQGDVRNPILDVTFDGLHIMDGDLVSSAPEIMISLLDENPFLALTDTSLLRVFLTDPLGQIAEYEVDGDILNFYPATGNISNENQARMEFRPELVVDGVYELQVRGKDASGNNSGDFDYKVNFEVINEETVSNVLNYPNPFSTSTQFVFTLTGNELPDVFRIQIMTVSGKIVKEIDMGELGPIRIGNNISDYRWDGTDDYGDQLANGVYLYRVVVKKEGEEYESYDNGTNKFFKKGFGKMVILR